VTGLGYAVKLDKPASFMGKAKPCGRGPVSGAMQCEGARAGTRVEVDLWGEPVAATGWDAWPPRA